MSFELDGLSNRLFPYEENLVKKGIYDWVSSFPRTFIDELNITGSSNIPSTALSSMVKAYKKSGLTDILPGTSEEYRDLTGYSSLSSTVWNLANCGKVLEAFIAMASQVQLENTFVDVDTDEFYFQTSTKLVLPNGIEIDPDTFLPVIKISKAQLALQVIKGISKLQIGMLFDFAKNGDGDLFGKAQGAPKPGTTVTESGSSWNTTTSETVIVNKYDHSVKVTTTSSHWGGSSSREVERIEHPETSSLSWI